MRSSQNITFTPPEHDACPWSLAGAVVGFASWLLALGIPFMIYGCNALFFLLYTWPFFLALMPVAIVVGIALHSLVSGNFLYSVILTVVMVAAMFGLLFMWLLG